MKFLSEFYHEAVKRLVGLIDWSGRIKRRLILYLVFRPATTGMLHISSGGHGEALVQVLRVRGQPYVPPTSVKGVFRRIVEHLFKGSLDSLGGLERLLAEAHSEESGGIVHESPSLYELGVKLIRSEDEMFVEKVLHRFMSNEDVDRFRAGAEEPEQRVLEPMLSALCPICRLIGSQGMAGTLKVMSVSLSVKGTVFRPHVGIDRSSRTRIEGAFFVEEAIQLDELKVWMVVDNPVPGAPEAVALAGLLEYLNKVGLMLGGGKSRGLGAFILDEGKSKGLILDYSKANTSEELADILALRLEDVATMGDGLVKVLSFLRGDGGG